MYSNTYNVLLEKISIAWYLMYYWKNRYDKRYDALLKKICAARYVMSYWKNNVRTVKRKQCYRRKGRQTWRFELAEIFSTDVVGTKINPFSDTEFLTFSKHFFVISTVKLSIKLSWSADTGKERLRLSPFLMKSASPFLKFPASCRAAVGLVAPLLFMPE